MCSNHEDYQEENGCEEGTNEYHGSGDKRRLVPCVMTYVSAWRRKHNGLLSYECQYCAIPGVPSFEKKYLSKQRDYGRCGSDRQVPWLTKGKRFSFGKADSYIAAPECTETGQFMFSACWN